MKKFGHLKVGDTVYVVDQDGRYTKGEKYEAQIVKMGNKYGYISENGTENKFCLETGCSYHGFDSNARYNGHGFDVYLSKSEHEEYLAYLENLEKVKNLLVGNFGNIKNISPEKAAKILEILEG